MGGDLREVVLKYSKAITKSPNLELAVRHLLLMSPKIRVISTG
jgi:hypothetical protein